MDDQTIEPDIADAVQQVANRYGPAGLEALIGRAQEALDEARRAYSELGSDR
jgi:hypothetical protein